MIGAYNLILDSRSETEQSREGIYTRFLGAREEKACFLFRATTEARIIFLSRHKNYTMKSLILAQDER